MQSIAAVSAMSEESLVSRHLHRHLEWCNERNLRPSYIDVRRNMIRAVARELGKPVEDATEDDLAGWYHNLTVRITPAARAVALSHVRCYFMWLLRERLIVEDPTLRLVRPRTRRRLPRPISTAELARALELAEGRTRTWMLLAAYQGMRAIEIAGLRVEDVDLANDLLAVTNGKGGKQRLLPLHPAVREALTPLPSRGYVFSHYNRAEPPRPHNVSHAINKHLRALGIPDTGHALRHWFATNIYRAGNDLRMTQELLGHASPQTTAIYTQWDQVGARSIVEGLTAGDAA